MWVGSWGGEEILLAHTANLHPAPPARLPAGRWEQERPRPGAGLSGPGQERPNSHRGDLQSPSSQASEEESELEQVERGSGWAALSTLGSARVKSCRLPAARLAASCLQGEAGATARDPEGRRQLGLHPHQTPLPAPITASRRSRKWGLWVGSPCQLSTPVAGEPDGQQDTEMADEVDWLDLPGRWTYGVDRGGRVFFIKYVVCLIYFLFL